MFYSHSRQTINQLGLSVCWCSVIALHYMMSGLNLSCQSLNHRVLITAAPQAQPPLSVSILQDHRLNLSPICHFLQYRRWPDSIFSLANYTFGKWERAWVVLTPYPVQHNARSPIIGRKEFGSWHMEKALCVPRASKERSSNLPAGGD